MADNIKTINELRQRILDGEAPSDDDLRAGILAIRAERRKPSRRLSFLRRLRRWIREAIYWLRYHQEDEANARLADAQERRCDDY